MHQLKSLNLPDAEVYFDPHFFSAGESDLYLRRLMEEVNWKQESIKLFGKHMPMPRLTAWYGDKGYTYSGLLNEPQPWLPVLKELKEKVEQASGKVYNSVLLNLYRTGQDSMGWHSDDEAALGKEPSIASLSFGAERRFSFKPKARKDIKPQSIPLTHGSLLLMQGSTQHHWLHHVPKTVKVVEPRINLTFRKVVV
jgi:alkylated DNA repair dioxygenase AlkB